VLRNVHKERLGPGLILWYDLSNGKVNEIWYFEIYRVWDVGLWAGSIWLMTFGFHKMRGICLLAENRLASQEELCSMK